MKSKDELGEELCDYCPRQENQKGVYSTPGGSCVGCEGCECDTAYEIYSEEQETKQKGDDMEKRLEVTMPDGSVWAVPVSVIAEHRATERADEFGGDAVRSLNEDTLPLFSMDDYAIEDWAENNMNWEDVRGVAALILVPPVDYQEGWVNGKKQVKQAT